MSTTKQYPDFNGLTFEKVWAALMENREQQKETDRLLKETALQMKEIERKREEEHDHEYKELRAQLGRLGNRLGEFMEYTVRPALDKKFNELGYHFDGTSTNQKIKDPLTGNTLTELDVILENDDSIIVVEAKVNPSEEDVNHFSYLDVSEVFVFGNILAISGGPSVHWQELSFPIQCKMWLCRKAITSSFPGRIN